MGSRVDGFKKDECAQEVEIVLQPHPFNRQPLPQVIITARDDYLVHAALEALAAVSRSEALAEQIVHSRAHRNLMRTVRKAPELHTAAAARLLPVLAVSEGVGDDFLDSGLRQGGMSSAECLHSPRLNLQPSQVCSRSLSWRGSPPRMGTAPLQRVRWK